MSESDFEAAAGRLIADEEYMTIDAPDDNGEEEDEEDGAAED